MELESSYQLLGVLRDDGIRTYNAVEIASGQPLQVHLFARPDSEADRTLFKTLRALPVSKRRELLEIGMEGDKPYIVTEKLSDSVTTREWLTRLAGLPTARPADPVLLAGSWKTGTPIPDELIRASHSSLPPKPPPPPPKPAELSPDYTRVMRLPQTLSPPQPEPPAPVPLEFAEPEPPPIAPAVPAQPAPPKVSPVVEPSQTGEFERMFADAPQLQEPTGIFLPGKLTNTERKEPGEFTRMFLASQPTQPNAPEVAALELAPEIAVPQPAPLEPAPEIAVREPAPPEPAPPEVRPEPVQPRPVAPRAAADPPGEFTRMFLASQPVEAAQPEVRPEPVTTPPVVPPPVPPPVPPQPVAAKPATHEPGEFTRMFLASQPAEPEPPVVTPQPLASSPGEFTSKFRTAERDVAAPPPEEATRVFQSVQFQATPPPSPSAPPVQPPSEETTRLFQVVTPSTPVPGPVGAAPPPPPKEPGEFTRMFPSPRSDSSAGLSSIGPSSAGPSSPAQGQPAPLSADSDGPSEFTRFFQSPMHPTPAGNQRLPSSSMPTPNATRPSEKAGEFTQMFGPRPGPSGPMPAVPAVPPLGAGGAFGNSGPVAPSSATGAFSIPRPSSQPAPKSSEAGEFTRMMSASSKPTLGQAPLGSALANSGPEPSKPKSMVPLYIIGGALLLAIVLCILFFMLRK